MNITKLFLTYTIFVTTVLSNTHITAMISNHTTQQLNKKALEQARKEHMLRGAAKYNDTKTLQHLIQCGVDINAQDNITKNTALHEAVEHEHQEATDILINNRAEINIRNRKGFTPLDITNLKHKISLLYIARGYNANDNSLNHYTQWCQQTEKKLEKNYQEHLLRIAAKDNDQEALTTFIQLGVNINAQDNNTKNTAIHEAVENEHKEAINILGTHGANVHIRNHKGFTPFDIITLKENMSLVDASGYITQNYAPENHAQACQMIAKNIENFYQEHLLHIAAKNNDQETLKYFIQLGVNINAQTNKTKCSPLHEAVEHGNIEATNILLANGANVNIQDCRGFTPLHIATIKQNMPLIHLLLGYNADVTIKNNNHYYPDNYIAWYPNGRSRANTADMKKIQLPVDSHRILLCARLEKLSAIV